MREARFAVPRKCPNCAIRKTITVISEDWQDVISSPVVNNDFDCPKCGKGFCGACFLPYFEGDGKAWYCPHCRELLQIPTGIAYHPHDLN